MVSKQRLIILGAGFSRPAGFPLAYDLWEEIRETALQASDNHRASQFKDDLNYYINFRKKCDGNDLDIKDVDFEDFMRFLDIEHFLGLRGKDTWSDHGNESTIVTKVLIGTILARHFTELEEIPALYLKFAELLEPRDVVITFNYDTLLEAALDQVNKPYRLFPSRYKRINTNNGSGVSDSANNGKEIVILKVHGSIDWFDRTRFDRRVALNADKGLPPPDDIIFSHDKELDFVPLVQGPRFSEDPLKNVYRVRNLKELYNKNILFNATPKMLPPSAAKLVYANNMSDFWRDMNHAGIHNFGMAIIGFSLPPQDEYARQIMYAAISNYQNVYWGENEFGRVKSPLTIVDYFKDDNAEEQFKNRYRFVDWERAQLFGNGFIENTLETIFK